MTATRKTPWLLIVLLALVVVAASAGGTYLYLSQVDVAKAAPVANKPQAPRLVTVAPDAAETRPSADSGYLTPHHIL